jgi:hypothetical protein
VTVVVGAVATIVVAPNPATVPVGGTQAFTAVGRDAAGNVVAITPTWSVVAGGGTITSAGVFTAGTVPGTFANTVRATSGGIAGSATVTITALPPTLTHLVLSPDTVTLAPGGTRQFSVTGAWSDGSTATPLVSYSATGGTIAAGGLYTAGSTAGTFRVIAVQQGGTLADTSAVTITSGGSGATVLFQESFDDANLAGRGWYDLPGGGITSITTLEHIPGSTASLQVSFPLGATSPNPAVGGRHLFTATDAVYLRYWVKYSASWVGTGASYGPHEFLFVTNVDGAYVGPGYTHLTTYVEQNYQNGGIAKLAAQDGQNIDEARVGLDLTGVTESRAVAGCNGNADGTPTDCFLAGTVHNNGKAWQSAQPVFLPNPGPGYKGDWHMVEAYFKLNSIVNGIGQLDGIAQYWFDGQLVIDKRNVLLRTGAHPTMSFNQFLFLPYVGTGSSVAQTMWVDNLVVMTGRP